MSQTVSLPEDINNHSKVGCHVDFMGYFHVPGSFKVRKVYGDAVAKLTSNKIGTVEILLSAATIKTVGNCYWNCCLSKPLIGSVLFFREIKGYPLVNQQLAMENN